MQKKEELECLTLVVAEIKTMYEKVDNMYDKLKNKFVLFSSGQLTYLAFLYGSADNQNQIKRLFIPRELSSQILYAIGIILAILSLTFLFQGFLPASWEIPPQSKDLKDSTFKEKYNLLTYLKNEYYKAYKHNLYVYEKKDIVYKKGLVCLVIGNIILFIIRFFGNIII